MVLQLDELDTKGKNQNLLPDISLVEYVFTITKEKDVQTNTIVTNAVNPTSVLIVKSYHIEITVPLAGNRGKERQ